MANDRFQRWQKITIDHLSYTINLLLTFGVATLGYCFSLLRDKDFLPETTAKCILFFAFISLALSVLVGVCCTFTRLLDFRGSTQRARENPEATSQEVLRIVGKITWFLFYIEVGMFGLGTFFLAAVMLLTYGYKLK